MFTSQLRRPTTFSAKQLRQNRAKHPRCNGHNWRHVFKPGGYIRMSPELSPIVPVSSLTRTNKPFPPLFFRVAASHIQRVGRPISAVLVSKVTNPFLFWVYCPEYKMSSTRIRRTGFSSTILIDFLVYLEEHSWLFHKHQKTPLLLTLSMLSSLSLLKINCKTQHTLFEKQKLSLLETIIPFSKPRTHTNPYIPSCDLMISNTCITLAWVYREPFCRCKTSEL